MQSANPPSTSPRLDELQESDCDNGWNDDSQLLPVTDDEAALESELDPIPPEGLKASGYVAALVIVLMVVLAEFTLLRADGFTGPAVFFPCAAALMFVGIPRRCLSFTSCLLTILLCCVSARLAYDGSWLLVGIAGFLFLALIVAFRHGKPFPFLTLLFGVESLWGGYELFLTARERTSRFFAPPVEDRSSQLFNIGIPLAVIVVSACAAVIIDPGLLNEVSGFVASQYQNVRLAQVTITEISLLHAAVWLLVLWITAGLIRPLYAGVTEIPINTRPVPADDYSFFAPLYAPLQNTLIVFNVIIAIVIFRHLETPATTDSVGGGRLLQWLIIVTCGSACLAAVIFRGAILADVRVGRMRILMYVALAVNSVLGLVALYWCIAATQSHGLNQQRVVEVLTVLVAWGTMGLLGGLIHYQQTPLWLFRRFSWIAGLAAFGFVVTPWGEVIQAHNVRQVIAGNKTPLTELVNNPIQDAELPYLLPLCDLKDPVIRDCVTAMIADRYEFVRYAAESQLSREWTARQYGIVHAYRSLRPVFGQKPTGLTQNAGPQAAMNTKQAKMRLREYAQELL